MEADASALDMPSDCCYFVVKAAAADAAPALNYFSSILHRAAVFTQNLGQTRASLAALIIAIISQNSAISTGLVLACVIASLAILYPNLAKLSNVSEDNPKARTLKGVTIFIAVYLGIIVLFATAAEKGVFDRFVSGISEAKLIIYSKLLMALLLAVPMLFFGNVAPKVPFNRYTGLRLPWTVRDEDTWIVAHRVLGYISAPIAILLFANVTTDMSLDTYVKFWWLGAVILWIAIPGIISGVFYYKKWHGKL